MFKQVTLTLGITFAIGSLLLPLGAYAKGAKDSSKVQVADAGGDNSGGGNTINHKLVEKYVHEDPSDIKGYKELQDRIAKIGETFPGLADAMKAQLADTDWYVVPKQISELPAKKTGLHFNTEQPVYQTRSEIFISEDSLNKMSADDVADTLVHEAVMSLTADKYSDQTRPVVVKLFAKKISVEKAQNALVKYNFGPYFSKEQMADLSRRNTMDTFFGNTLYHAKPLMACQGTEEDEKLYAAVANEEVSSWDWIGVTMDLSSQLMHESGAKEPGDVWVGCGGLSGLSWNTVVRSESLAPCREVEKIYGDEDRIRGLKLPNIDTRLNALKFAAKQYDGSVEEHIAKLVDEMSRSNAYLSLMAILPKDSKADTKGNLARMTQYRPERRKLYDMLKKKIDQRRAQIDFSDKAALYRLRCNSYKALAHEYEKLAPAAAVEKYGLDKKEGESSSLDDDQPIAVKHGSAE